MKLIFRLFFVTALFASCGDDAPTEPTDSSDGVDACFTCDRKADRSTYSDEEAEGVLRLVNGASRYLLDVDVQLDRRAANHIIDHRNEEGPFISLVDLDAVPYVGPTAFVRLLIYARANGYIASNFRVHDIVEGSVEAQNILTVTNSASFTELDDVVGLDRRAATRIIQSRPIATLTELDSVGYVGKSAFQKLRDYVDGGVCESEKTESWIQGINGVNWGDFSREVRTDLALADAIQQQNWPAQISHAGCFGVRPNDLPPWIPVTDPEDDTRIKNLFRAYSNSAARFGVESDIDGVLEELDCRTEARTFVGCRFEFEPNPFSGITWNIIESDDGAVRFLFVSRWAE